MYSDLDLHPTMPNTEHIQHIQHVLISSSFNSQDLTFYIVINAENFKLPLVTLTLITQWPMSKHVRVVII